MLDGIRDLARVGARNLSDRVGLAYHEEVLDVANEVLRLALGRIPEAPSDQRQRE